MAQLPADNADFPFDCGAIKMHVRKAAVLTAVEAKKQHLA